MTDAGGPIRPELLYYLKPEIRKKDLVLAARKYYRWHTLARVRAGLRKIGFDLRPGSDFTRWQRSHLAGFRLGDESFYLVPLEEDSSCT